MAQALSPDEGVDLSRDRFAALDLMDEYHGVYPIAADVPPKNIVFLGDREVGKTSFITNYCDHMRDYYQCETYRGPYLVFTQFLHFHRYHYKRVPVRLLDLPAGTSNQSRRDHYPAQAHSIVLCFSITEPRSLLHVTNTWIPEFRRHLSEETWMYLLGLKTDRRRDMRRQNQNPVSRERARQVWEEHRTNDSEYMECSVQENPAEARSIIERFIHESFVHEAEPPLAREL